MRIISRKTLREFWARHPRAEKPLREWEALTQSAEWQSIIDVRRTFPHADAVTVESGNTVVVFNIGGNAYRLVTAVKFQTHVVYTLLVLTHPEYSKVLWKKHL
jgi:mRNA interferase HigB